MQNVHNYFRRTIFCLFYGISVRGEKRVSVKFTSYIGNRIRVIWRSKKGNFIVGENSKICDNAKIIMAGGNLYIGDDTCLGENTIVNVFNDVYIGNNVVTADNVAYITNTHYYEDISHSINSLGGTDNPIYIGDDSWIGINVTILDGTKIGKHCVVGAGAVVKGEFPDYCVIAGVPARVIKQYNFEKKIWERIK